MRSKVVATINTRLKGTLMMDCIPQNGPCPMHCTECFYNDHWYRTLDEPLMPSIEESEGHIVRVNPGHDSNIQRDMVIHSTSHYRDKFYNTAIPRLEFGWPTILTINSRDNGFYHPSEIRGDIRSLMAARFRLSTWNIDECVRAIDAYSGVDAQILLTPILYHDKANVKDLGYYEFRKLVINGHWVPNSEGQSRMKSLLANPKVLWCGNPFDKSIRCRDCQLCVHLYVSALERLKQGMVVNHRIYAPYLHLYS